MNHFLHELTNKDHEEGKARLDLAIHDVQRYFPQFEVHNNYVDYCTLSWTGGMPQSEPKVVEQAATFLVRFGWQKAAISIKRSGLGMAREYTITLYANNVIQSGNKRMPSTLDTGRVKISSRGYC